MADIPSLDIVELIVTGQVGLNLQATKYSSGAFVDSFYRGVDIDGSEVILPAEANLGANFLGAIISSVNNQDVTGSHAITVCDIISKADRPMTLKFFLNSQIIENPLDLSNFAGLPWLLEHIEELSTKAETISEDLHLLKRKLLLYIDCERVLLNIAILQSTQRSKLWSFVDSLRSFVADKDDQLHEKHQVFLKQTSDLLRSTILEKLVPSFIGSLAMRRMKGYLFNFPLREKLAFVDIMDEESLLAHFFIFLSRSGKRHVLLLCYIQIRDAGMATDSLRNLIICSAALNICKEPYLQKAKGDLDHLISALQACTTSKYKRNDGKSRSNVSSFYLEAQYILSNIMDCLAWEYTITIYPSFEISKDYSTLRSSMVADISSCITTDSEIQSTHRSKDGSLNELLRTKRIPSSLTIHRRVRAESNEVVLPTHRNPSTIKILLFDSCADVAHSDNQQSSPKLIGVDATEEVCMRAQVQVRGKIEVVGYRTVLSEEQEEIGRQEKSIESLRALSTFFVPTGKPVILEKSSSNQTADDKQGPSAKLYSMVLNARDQTPLYACSLVFYRSFRLQNLAENQSSITPNFNDTRDDFKNSGHPVDQRSKQNIGNESNIKGTRISFTTPIVADNERNQANIKNPFLEDAESVLSTPQYNLVDLSLCIVDSTLNLDALTIAVTSPNTTCRESLPCAFRVQPVSEMTAATPLHEHTSLKESSANFLETKKSGIKAPIELLGLASGTFSDDESAGIKSSIKSSSDELMSPQRMPEQADTRIPSENAKPLHGTFAEFLSATANVTASVASALAFQAGSLPTSSFAWSANSHSNSNANELKGFYDNLSFSRFKAKHFSTISNGDHKYSEVGSKLKRKYDDDVIHSPVALKVTNLLSSHSSLTTPTVQSETYSNSPLVLQSTFESDNPSQSWVFSPQKYSLSSYPKFGTGKPTKKNGASPRTPRSPCRKGLPQNHGRKSRSAVTLASRQGAVLSSTETIPKSNNSNKFDFLISDGSSATIDDSKFSPKMGTVIIQDIQERTATSVKNCERSVGHLIAERSQFLIDEKHTMAHASYGFTLISEVPVMEYLRKVAYLVAPEFEKKYDKMMNSDGTSPPSSGDLEELSQIIKENFSNASSLSGVDILDKCKLLSTSDMPSTTYKETFSNRESSPDGNINETDEDNEADYNSIIVFDALSPKNVVTVLIAFLLEYRIVAVSSRALSASTHLGEWLKDAINPLKYAHVYSPLVPPCIGLQLIHCPAPFYIGMRRSPKIDEIVELEDERDREKNEGRRGKPALPRDSNCGLLLVDLDRDECSMPQDLCSLVRSAKVLIRALESLLYPHLYNCDEIDAGIQREVNKPEKLAHDATKLCKRFVRSLLEGSKQSCLSAKDGDEIVVLFDETLFIHQHSIQLSLNRAIIDIDFEAEKWQLDLDCKNVEQNTRNSNANNVDFSRYQESMLPSTTTGNKDIQNLLRYLMRTQSFSSYLTS